MKKRTNVSLSDGSLELAEQVMAVRRRDKLTPLLEDLIREEWERRFGLLTGTNPGPANPALNDAAPSSTAAAAPAAVALSYAEVLAAKAKTKKRPKPSA